jgi:RNA polymerase primary sigma factor
MGDRSLAGDEQKRLLQRAALGDTSSQERLVEAYLPTVVRLAAVRTEQGLPLPDLVQEGSIGLIEAIRTFAASGETDFAKFAEGHITAQLATAIDAELAAVREAQAMITAAEDYDRTEVVLRRELRRAPTEQELAEKLEWTVERTRYIGQVVNEARQRHDEELLAFIDPEAIDFDADGESESESAIE